MADESSHKRVALGSLKSLNLKEVEQLSRNQLKEVLGGSDIKATGALCRRDSIGLCGANCMRPNGAADKCRENSSGQCTCGGL